MIRVRYIDVVPWKGPRHERLRAIWRAIEKTTSFSLVEFKPFINQGRLSHADCLSRMWYEESKGLYDTIQGEADLLIITELDFLPEPGWIGRVIRDLGNYQALAPVKQRDNAGDTETWFMALRPKAIDHPIRWYHENDPGADLHKQIDVKHFTGKLGHGGLDDHLGWEYTYGVHLLGSRHLHDPPETPLWKHEGKMLTAGEFQENHDRAVDRWVKAQPKIFQELLT